ncbi:MAG: cytochrome c biogenesis protein CcdA [Candidatus Omnitrophota bacterium]
MNFLNGLWEYAIVFGSGVMVSFTPCIYPVIPLTASLIAGANVRGTKRQGFILSVLYVTGLAVSYCALAVLAALTGRVFGQIQNSPLTLILIANVLVVFALALFDAFPLPSLGLSLQNKIRPRNGWTLFLLGVFSGLIIGPCTAPILGTLLLYVASKQNILHGISLVFVFSYGVGASLILIGTFSGLLGALPKSGPWLVRIKRVCGLILFLMAEYLLIRAGLGMR